MGKDQNSFVKDKKEEVEVPTTYVCVRKCFFSEDGNPILSRVWLPGEEILAVKSPSSHFVKKNELGKGDPKRNKLITKLYKLGVKKQQDFGIIPIRQLQSLAAQKEREWLRRKATE